MHTHMRCAMVIHFVMVLPLVEEHNIDDLSTAGDGDDLAVPFQDLSVVVVSVLHSTIPNLQRTNNTHRTIFVSGTPLQLHVFFPTHTN